MSVGPSACEGWMSGWESGGHGRCCSGGTPPTGIQERGLSSVWSYGPETLELQGMWPPVKAKGTGEGQGQECGEEREGPGRPLSLGHNGETEQPGRGWGGLRGYKSSETTSSPPPALRGKSQKPRG